MPEFRLAAEIDGVPTSLRPGDARVGSALVAAPVPDDDGGVKPVGEVLANKLAKNGDGSSVAVAPPGGIARSLSQRARDVIWAADYGVVADAVLTNGVITAGTDQTVKLQNAINIAVAAKRDLMLPPGDILLSTTYPSGRTERGLGPYNLKVQGGSKFRILGAARGGSRFVSPPQTSVQLWVNESDNFDLVGVKFHGDPNGMGVGGNGQFSAALALYSVRDFRVADIETTGGKGSIIHGNFVFNGTFERITQTLVANESSGFDVASMQNVEVRRHIVRSLGGGQGFQHIYDLPNDNQAFNLTGITLAGGRSNGLRLTDGDYSGMNTPVSISEVDDVWVERNNIHDNLRPSGDFLAGIAVGANSAVPMRNINIIGNRFSKNGSSSGTAGFRGGLILNSNAAPIFATVRDNKFFDNSDSGIIILGGTVTLQESGNRYLNTGAVVQSFDYSGTPILASQVSSGLSVRPGGALLSGAYNAFGTSVAYTPTLTSAGAITSQTTTGRYIRIGNLVWVRIIVSITTNGTGAFPLRATLPFTAAGAAMLSGGETESQGVAEFGEILAGGTTVHIKTVTGTYPGGDGRTLVVSGMYEAVP